MAEEGECAASSEPQTTTEAVGPSAKVRVMHSDGCKVESLPAGDE